MKLYDWEEEAIDYWSQGDYDDYKKAWGIICYHWGPRFTRALHVANYAYRQEVIDHLRSLRAEVGDHPRIQGAQSIVQQDPCPIYDIRETDLQPTQLTCHQLQRILEMLHV